MKPVEIDKALFILNRNNLKAKLKNNAIAVIHANDHMPTNADGHMAYKQNSDLFYLSGIQQEQTILLLYPDSQNKSFTEVLFIRETNELVQVWEGHKLTKEQARTVSGIENIQWLSQFESVLHALIFEAEYIYLPTNEHVRATIEVESRNARFIKWCKEHFPLHKYERLSPLLQSLRTIKSDTEIRLIQEACNLTEAAFRRVLTYTKPDVWEYEIEAEFAHEFIRQGYGFADYGAIIASGTDSCILHYHDNNKQCKDGDIILMDVAGGVANYNADMTRTIPVNGKFSARQKEVYNAVLRIMRYAISQLTVGNTFEKYNKAVAKIVEKELIELNLLKAEEVAEQSDSNPLYKKYFMHGVSHFLGLDVHDVGSRFEAFKAGMILTCEPGIYIPKEAIGIRLENNILVTENGPVDMMANIPIEADEIEALMNSRQKHL